MENFGGDGPSFETGPTSGRSSGKGGDPFDFFLNDPKGKKKKPRPSASDLSNRLPPHNLEAERSVIGAILINNEIIDRVRELGLDAEHFYDTVHQRIYDVACSLSDKRTPIDLLTLSNALKDRGWFEEVGGNTTLTQLFDEAFHVGNSTHYAQIIRDKAMIRMLIDRCAEIMADGYAGVEDTEEFLDEAESKVFAVANVKFEQAVVELKNILLSNMAAIEELSVKDKDVTGLSTGFSDFDRMTTGLHPGQVMIVAARPGMGKTSWFLSALQHAALTDQSVVALFSLEMSKEEIGFRFLSGLSKIDSRKLKTGRLAQQDWHRLAEAADRLSKSRIFVDDSGGITVMDIRARSRRLKSKNDRLDLIVVDYLQLMKGSKGARGGEFSREREISEISRNLKELAKELGVPIIALSQLNRGVEQRQDKRPNLSDLRESGAIEQDADLVCFIHRDDYYDRESENRGIAEFIIAKNRSGDVGTVKLAWIGKYTLFENLSDDQPGVPVGTGYPEKGDITL